MSDREFNKIMQDNVIVIYDGICGFCNASIRFILKQKPSKKLRFVSFQSEIGKKIRSLMNINESLDSIIVIENNKYFKKSEAAFRIIKHIQSNWKYLSYFDILPQSLSDFVYNLIAANRYRIKQNSCTMPSAEEKEFFIP